MHEFTQANIEKWLQEFVKTAPLNCTNAEKFNAMCFAMKNMTHMDRAFSEEDAREWIMHMNPPARWTIEQTTALMNQHGYKHKPCEFWAVMNSLASDYGHTFIKFNIDKPDIWAELAHDWLYDIDAEDDKAGRYFRDIVRHHVDNM